MRLLRVTQVVGIFAALALGVGCASPRPYVSVLGVAEPDRQARMVVMVEVHNPTQTPLRLSQLEYILDHGPEGKTARGRVRLNQTVAPGASKVIDIPVPVFADAAYRLEGQLRGFAGDVAVSFDVAAASAASAP